MNFLRSIVSALMLLLVASGAAPGQAPQNKLSFDVATVKPYGIAALSGFGNCAPLTTRTAGNCVVVNGTLL